MAGGSGFTVTTAVLKQDPIVYEIVAVPSVTPVTLPDVTPTETFELLLLHVPPDVVLVRAIVEPRHTVVAPAIGAGIGLTVTTVVVMQSGPAI
jgi:hypothetical protein